MSTDIDDGFEFRPPKNGTYLVEFKDRTEVGSGCTYPFGYDGDVTADARGDRTTDATIAVGQTINGHLNWRDDRDYFRVTLKAGKRYTATVLDHIEHLFAVEDTRGEFVYVGGDFNVPDHFTVPKDGTYFVVVGSFEDSASVGGTPYTLKLISP